MLTFLSTHENLWWEEQLHRFLDLSSYSNYLLLHFWVRILVAAVITNTKYFSGYLKDRNLILIFIKWDCWHNYLYWGTRHRLIWECGVQESFLTLPYLSHHQVSICHVPIFFHLPTNYLYTVLGCMTRDTGIWYCLLQDRFNLFVGENGISSSEWTWRHVPAVTEGIKINNWSTCYLLFGLVQSHSSLRCVSGWLLAAVRLTFHLRMFLIAPVFQPPKSHTCQSSASHHLKIGYLICFLIV